MNDYPPEMYNEILEYYNFRYGKFLEIPYPTINNYPQLHHGNQQQSNQTSGTSD